jgi:succinate dehydrogenase / fumarate reductase cytochrome b subunit
LGSTATAESIAAGNHHSFFWRRLHSLTGIVPLGVFLIEHFASNAAVISRTPVESYGNQVKFLNGLPGVLALEIALIYAPLLFHGIYGLWIVRQADVNVGRYSWLGNWAYTWQRITGIVVFVFIFWHGWTARFSGVSLPDQPYAAFGKMQAMLVNNWLLAWFIVGIVTVSYHFAYGLYLFAAKWGITIGAATRRRWAYACLFIGIVLAYFGVASALAFRGVYIYPPR